MLHLWPCLLLVQETDRNVGWQVGSDPEIQVATVVSNHLTAGVMKYFSSSGRCQPAANLFEKLAAREPEIASLLARSYIGMSALDSPSFQDTVPPDIFYDKMRKLRQSRSCLLP